MYITSIVHILYIIYVMYALYVNVCHICNVCKICNVCIVCNICYACSGARRDHAVHAQGRRHIASYGATVIATCTHVASAGWQVGMRPSSQLGCTLQSQDHHCIANCVETVITTSNNYNRFNNCKQ